MHRRHLLPLTGSLLLPRPARAAMEPALDAAIDSALAEGRVAGAVVLVRRDGATAYRRAAGHADREAGVPMREDTLFRLASVTKPFVAAAALALVDRGVLALDAPVTTWLPGFRPALPGGGTPAITLRHLLSHSAGLGYGFLQGPDGPYLRAGVSDGLDRSGLSLAENLARIASVPLAYPPGEGWGYSVATDVLGAAMAAATGLPLPEVVRRWVTAPLGLDRTGFVAAPAAPLATPYVNAASGPVRMPDPCALPFGPGRILFSPGRAFDPGAFPSGGGGMIGGADDVATLLEAIRQGGAPILSPESARAMVQDAVPGQSLDMTGPGWGFGLGVSVLRDPGAARTPQSPGTWKWGGVYGHSWFVDPVRKLTVVALTNTAPEGVAGRFTTDICDAAFAGG